MTVRATVGVVTKHAFPYERQIHAGLRAIFAFDESNNVDYLVVIDAIDQPVETSVSVERSLLVCGEPPSIKSYDPQFLAQFGHVWSVDPRTAHPGHVLSHPAIPWFYGVSFNSGGIHPNLSTFEDLINEDPTKTREVSIIASGKSRTEGHRFRLAFIEELRSQAGVPIDIFGRDSAFVADKREAIAPYRYHIVLENDVVDHYWTEKIADAFLGWSFPIYRGAPNAAEYFPASSFVEIPQALSPTEAVYFALQSINGMAYHARREAIARARQRLLYEHNLFSALDSYVHIQQRTGKVANSVGTPRTILPEEEFGSARKPLQIDFRRLPVKPLALRALIKSRWNR